MKGACLRYDAVKEILIAKPFTGGVNCWNSFDWIIILLPIYIFIHFTIIAIISLPWVCITRIVRIVSNALQPIHKGDARFIATPEKNHVKPNPSYSDFSEISRPNSHMELPGAFHK